MRFVGAHRIECDPEDAALFLRERGGHRRKFVRRFFRRDVPLFPQRELEIEAHLVKRLRHLVGCVFERAAVATVEEPFLQNTDVILGGRSGFRGGGRGRIRGAKRGGCECGGGRQQARAGKKITTAQKIRRMVRGVHGDGEE